MSPLLVIGIIVIVLLLYVWSLYNGFVTLRMQIEEAWSQIDVQLKRRADLIPNLVETVKGYAKHEKSIITAVTDAHKAMLGAKTMDAKANASDALSGAVGRLLALGENYPNLKANDNFVQLQKELEDTEDKVAYARQYYNSSVMEFNTRLQVFPNSMLAGTFGFLPKEFFGASDEERKPVKVNFN